MNLADVAFWICLLNLAILIPAFVVVVAVAAGQRRESRRQWVLKALLYPPSVRQLLKKPVVENRP